MIYIYPRIYVICLYHTCLRHIYRRSKLLTQQACNGINNNNGYIVDSALYVCSISACSISIYSISIYITRSHLLILYLPISHLSVIYVIIYDTRMHSLALTVYNNHKRILVSKGYYAASISIFFDFYLDIVS